MELAQKLFSRVRLILMARFISK